MIRHLHIAPGAAAAVAIAEILIDDIDRDAALIAIPRPQVQLVVRFGPDIPRGVDLHVSGVRRRAYRKRLPAGRRALTARLHVDAAARVFGVPASALADQPVPLAELWDEAAVDSLIEQLAAAHDTRDAVPILEAAIAARLAHGAAAQPSALVRAATRLLATAGVHDVAIELGVSERHLRRVFHDAVGISPKAFARLERFHRALAAARDHRASWAGIAASTGYYDQAHLIDEFRAIAGVTPTALLAELAL